ncbi:MAG TPA: NIL domain-containing protein [Nodosilinea sp.]|nr:NIL domain-containing protein [Nodosilinea sp.]
MAFISPAYELTALGQRPPDSLVQTHVRVRIPKARHADPVLSNLVNRYRLRVTILGALLSANGQEDGWFELELSGTADRLHQALLDLVELDADLWFEPEAADGL